MFNDIVLIATHVICSIASLSINKLCDTLLSLVSLLCVSVHNALKWIKINEINMFFQEILCYFKNTARFLCQIHSHTLSW